jgi:mono/diheme cytochrome c family protein
MYSRIVVSLLALAALGLAQSPAGIKMVPLSPTSPASGPQMFNNYCASCHGKSGQGNGPAASALKKGPADLTQLTTRNNGKFPEMAIFHVIEEGGIAAHGSKEMPVWGDILRSVDGGAGEMTDLRIANLTTYIKTLQRK